MSKTQREAEKEVRSRGFKRVITWTDAPNAYYSPHKHEGLTTHLLLKGTLTFRYPEDKDAAKTTIGVGETWDVDAEKVHEVWVGGEGATMVIGE